MRNVIALAAAILLAIGLALPAAATHTHARLLGNGGCVILAQNGGEKYVDLPGDRTHPLHSNVHKGEPGTREGQTVVWVYQSTADPCPYYVND